MEGGDCEAAIGRDHHLCEEERCCLLGHNSIFPTGAGRERIASRYISEGGKARHDASLRTELYGEGRRYTGLGCFKPGKLGPAPISVLSTA